MLSCIRTVHYLCSLLRLSVLAPFWRHTLSSACPLKHGSVCHVLLVKQRCWLPGMGWV